MIVTGQSQAVAKWLGQKFGVEFLPPFEAVGILNSQGQRVGAALLNNWADRNIELSVFGRGAFTRGVNRHICRYVFETLDCRRMTATTRISNAYVRRLLTHHGFQQEGILRHWYDDEDAAIYGLLKADCHFLR